MGSTDRTDRPMSQPKTVRAVWSVSGRGGMLRLKVQFPAIFRRASGSQPFRVLTRE